MENLEKFEKYLVYDENGAPIGLIPEAPAGLKIEFRKQYMEEQDLERLGMLFSQQY